MCVDSPQEKVCHTTVLFLCTFSNKVFCFFKSKVLSHLTPEEGDTVYSATESFMCVSYSLECIIHPLRPASVVVVVYF